ncbi:hypothetical protein JOQ06_029693, partial [Pogonophryne albipinna]
METSAPTATEKKECKGSGLDGSSFSELPKKPSPTTLTRETCLALLNVSVSLSVNTYCECVWTLMQSVHRGPM